MESQRPPSLDPIAADAWHRRAPAASPWLHDEVARRMEDRLEWIKLQPAAWAHWEPVRGGWQAQELLRKRYPAARCTVVETQPRPLDKARAALAAPWWRRWGPGVAVEVVAAVPPGSVQMLWANMALHMAPEPAALIGQWHDALGTDGFLMFSCLGPDTLVQLRALYAALGWAPPAHEFTDMHDWGDMLVHAGFAEPVMDMERITLTWESPARLLGELRELGANLHVARSRVVRGRKWRGTLEHELSQHLRGADGRLALTFEIVYGHAFKPPPRVRVSEESSVSLQQMRALLGGGKQPRA